MASDHFQSSLGKQTVSEVESSLIPSEIYGADIRFHGVVRNSEDNRKISAIRYTFYEAMALNELEAIGTAMGNDYPDHLALVFHRVGEVAAGDASILIRVQTKHSAPGFEIAQEYLRRIKQTVPIWKEPIFIESQG